MSSGYHSKRLTHTTAIRVIITTNDWLLPNKIGALLIKQTNNKYS